MLSHRLIFVFLAFAAACTAEGPGTDADLLDADESDDADVSTLDGKADSLASTSTYYVARRDTRRCVSPMCGGYFVHRVNFSRTRCADGRWESECYAAELDLAALSLDGELQNQVESQFGAGTAVLRGSLRTKTYDLGRFGQFVATEAYRAASDAPAGGTFYTVRDNGIRCIAAPCFSLHEAKLNSTLSRNLSDLDLAGVGASDADVAAASARLFEGGLLVAGTNRRVPRAGPAGTGVRLDAAQFYLPFAASVKHCGGIAGLECAAGQYCSYEIADICGAADATGTCEARPDVCTREFHPVCGCDGRTYSNRCNAAASGTSVQSEGPCATPPSDCRSAGCGEGRECQYCWGSFACVPEGALC